MVTDMEVEENIVEQFLEESNEHLKEIEDSLLKLEDNPLDLEEINKVFRAMHSIKGGGQMFGYSEIGAFAHEFETFFEFVRKGTLTLNPESISLTLNACDLMKKMFSAQAGEEAADESAMLIECLRDLYVSTEKSAVFSKKKDSVFWVRFIPQIDIFSSGIDVIEILEECHHIGQCEMELDMENIPLLDEMDPSTSYFSWTMITTSTDGIEPIQCIFLFIDEAKSTLRIEPISSETIPADETVKRLFAQYQKNSSQTESPIAAPGLPAAVNPTPIRKLSSETVSPPSSPDEIANVKVPFQKLDKLVNLVGELITVKDQLSQYSQTHSDVELMLISEKVENLSWELRDHTMNIRMLPVGTIFNKYRRLVRDLASSLGKEVDLEITGSETEIDKTIIEKLSDPLLHIIRNSIDHGLELPAVRESLGKPKKGTIRLAASHSGADICIDIEDDGAGINLEKVKAKSVEKGLIPADKVLSDKEALDLIFMPGFSTAETVSNLSGRGVGMDVVKRAITDMQGAIDIQSRQGHGTTISLRLPLTLAIIDGLLVDVQGSMYIIPLSAIEECVELAEHVKSAGSKSQLISLRNEMIPYFFLKEYFQINGSHTGVEQIVIVNSGRLKVGIVVDKVIGELPIIIKSLGKYYKNVKGLSGVTILGNGSLAMVVDIPRIIQTVEIEGEVLC